MRLSRVRVSSAPTGVTSNILAWPTSLLPQGVTRAQVLDGSAALSYELVTAPEGGAGLSDGAVTGAATAALTVAGDLPAEVTTAHPNLNGYIALKASLDEAGAGRARARGLGGHESVSS